MKEILKNVLIVLGIVMALSIIWFIKLMIDVKKEFDNYDQTHYPYISYFGESDSRSYGYGGCGASIDFETFYGITLETDGSDVICTPYSHKSDITLKSVTLNSISSDTWKERVVKSLSSDGIGFPITFSVSDLYNGKFDAIYTVTAVFCDPNEKDDSVVTGYLHVAKSIAKCCRVKDNPQDMTDEQEADYQKIVENLNPEDYLDSSKLCYPTTYSGKTNVYKSSYSSVEEYQKLSDQLITDDSWSDAVKVYAFVKYMTDNYAYDEYQVEKLHNKARAVVAKDVDNPAYWLYSSHVGMCQDFMNAMVIMCRYHDIPCTSLSSSKHVIPVVYINNEWVAIDINPLLPKCTQENMNSAGWEYPESFRWDKEYGFAAGGMDMIEDCIDYIPKI